MKHLINIYRLGIKEFQGLGRDKVLMALIIYAFSLGIYVGAESMSSELNNAPIAFIDEDRSALSMQIINSFTEPYFSKPEIIDMVQEDKGLDSGKYTFAVTIPDNFEKDVINGERPEILVNIDATRMSQAGIGAGYIQNIILKEVNYFLNPSAGGKMPIELSVRLKYNPNLESSWFGGVNEMLGNIAMFSIMLTGAALIREREHGTLEHLLVMPLNAAEIVLAKIWSMGLVILLSTGFALIVILKWMIGVPFAGSVTLFLAGCFLLLFSTTSLGIFMGTVARTMPQLGLISIMTILPLQILSGGVTPFESMPKIVQTIMLATPTSHFVTLSQAILFRGAGIAEIWQNMLAIFLIGIVFFVLSMMLFRKSISAA